MTDRHLVSGDFLCQIEKVAATKPTAVILREKDLSENAYERLAVKVMEICKAEGVNCYFNSRIESAVKLGAQGVQLSLQTAQTLDRQVRSGLPCLGISVHSAAEAVEAQNLGASYIIYGHVFATDCKKGVPPRGIEALRTVCRSVTVPVFAIGGIHPQNASRCIDAGAYGVCMMSEYMKL